MNQKHKCKLRRTSSVIIFLLFALIHVKAQKSPIPKWVEIYDFKNHTTEDQNPGYQYLLLDNQENIAEQTSFSHYVFKVTNNEGVQNMSNISVSYDPSFQKLNFHEINVIRDGKKIDRLSQSSIQKIQRETSMEMHLYDGAETAYTNLSDVRPGDIIEYSYSIKGYSPLNTGHFSQRLSLEFNIPVGRIINRLIADNGMPLTYKLFNGADSPKVIEEESYKIYIWDVESNESFYFDSYVPSWYNPLKYVSVTSFSSWAEVVDWANKLYNYSDSDMKNVTIDYNKEASIEMKITTAIQFVQDEIRYLGLESGIGAYKPNSPLKVFEQRFGDCKDKSLLLVSLLRQLGLESSPMLVNTTMKNGLAELLPSQNVFDHCVVTYDLDGKTYYVDPTISNQGGNVSSRYFPDYQQGLVLKNGESELRKLPSPIKNEVFIKEWFVLDSINGGAYLKVRSEYKGAVADEIRGEFASNSSSSITKRYVDFYSSLYSNIKANTDVKILDYQRGNDNLVITEEEYDISSVWSTAEDQELIYFETYPLYLENLIGFGDVGSPTMPYNMGASIKFRQESVVDMPEVWEVTTLSKEIKGANYHYKNQLSSAGKTVQVVHEYESENGVIEPESVPAMLTDHNKIQSELQYVLTYNSNLTGFNISIPSVILAMLGLGIGLFLILRINRIYNPSPWEFAENKSIGGWLILPAIGLIISAVRISIDIVSPDFFNKSLWVGLSGLTDNSFAIKAFVALEIIINFVFIIFVIYLIFQFFSRATRTPRLMVYYYSLGLALPLIDSVGAWLLFQDTLSPTDFSETFRDIGRSVIGAAIWIPYFLKSERVKSTFCKQRMPPSSLRETRNLD